MFTCTFLSQTSTHRPVQSADHLDQSHSQKQTDNPEQVSVHIFSSSALSIPNRHHSCRPAQQSITIANNTHRYTRMRYFEEFTATMPVQSAEPAAKEQLSTLAPERKLKSAPQMQHWRLEKCPSRMFHSTSYIAWNGIDTHTMYPSLHSQKPPSPPMITDCGAPCLITYQWICILAKEERQLSWDRE